MTRASVRLGVEIALVVVILLYLGAWSARQLLNQRAAAHQAAVDLHACEQLAQQIELLRRRPVLAGESQRQADKTTRLIEGAVAHAGLSPASSLLRISPEPPRRIGTSSHQEVPTQLVLKDVTLEQLIQVLLTVSEAGSGLEASEVRLTAPRDEPDGAVPSTWLAEVTLSQLVYSPIDEASRQRR